MCRASRSDTNLRTAVTVVTVAAVAVAVGRPVLHAGETVLGVVLIAAAAAAGVAVLAAVAFIVIRLHRSQAHALRALPVSRALAAGRPAAAIPAQRLLAIDAPRPSAAAALGLDELEKEAGATTSSGTAHAENILRS
jgi:hypothetical protein